MKKFLYTFSYLAVALLFLGTTLQAQVVSRNFEGNSIGDTFNGIGWAAADVQAAVAADPLAAGNKVMRVQIGNYNAAPYLTFVLPAGKTLADYTSFTFKGYFEKGDVGYKNIMVEAYQTRPTGQFNNPAAMIGQWNRAMNGSTAWEDITINITNTTSFSDTIYIAFGIHAAGTGAIGGANSPTTWYADDVTLVGAAAPNSLITQWGRTPQGAFWKIENTAATPAGEASISGTAPLNGGGQATIRGHFGQNMPITTDEALIISGKLELVGTLGGESSYNPMRFAVAYHADDTLNYALTDSARWVRAPGSGYLWSPRTGSGTVANGSWGSGTVGILKNGNWNSTNSNGGPAVATVLQAPRNAQIVPGTYDWAISVQQIDDTTNEVRWYLVEEDNKYWFGGTIQDTAVTHQLNAIDFGFNTGDWTKITLKDVQTATGDAITVPEAPWESYYLDQWGTTPQGKFFKIKNDTTFLIGDGTIEGTAPINGGGQATIRGGLGQNLQIKTDQALIVRGQLELVGALGGESSYNPMRFALAYHADDTLKYALTDSAQWVRAPGSGYLWSPRTGSGTVANGSWGSGTVGILKNGNWNSTNSNGGPAVATVLQAPRNAQMVPGIYDWAISVQQIDDTTNEVRWYLIEEDNKYWFGGTIQDTAVTHQLNAINFGFNTGDWTKINVIAAEVDYGNAITVPEAPWESYYLDQWGTTPQGKFFQIKNDSTFLIGDATIEGTAPLNGGGQATIRGGLGQNLQIKTDKALIVRGQLELVGVLGGESSYNPMRFAVAYHADDTLKYALTDSAQWVRAPGSGYLWSPRTGSGTVANGSWGSGTVGILNNGNWNSTNSNGGPALATVLQAPRNAQMVPGIYDWAISVQQVNDTTNEVRWYLIQEDNEYWFGGTIRGSAVTHQLNAINFGFNTGDWTKINVIAAEVDYGPAITVPVAPFEPFYVGDWAFLSRNNPNWALTPGEVTGNVGVAGNAATDWVAVRGGFPEAVQLRPDTSLVITGKMELVGGGFEAFSSLRMGVFHSDSAGTIDSTTWTWSGNENGSKGYLFIPHSGTNDVTNWQGISQLGTAGAVVDRPWLSTNGANDYVLSANKQYPADAVGAAGTYDFAFSFTPMGTGTEVRYYIHNSNYQFGGAVLDNHSPLTTNRFNSINFAVNNPTTTGLNLVDVYVDLGDTISVPSVVGVNDNGVAPIAYALSQNYPNPFNPSTTIEFAVPQNGRVTLTVYDALGRVVSELVNADYTTGYHKVSFNASNLASGVYFYKIKAGDFVSVKKLMLLK